MKLSVRVPSVALSMLWKLTALANQLSDQTAAYYAHSVTHDASCAWGPTDAKAPVFAVISLLSLADILCRSLFIPSSLTNSKKQSLTATLRRNDSVSGASLGSVQMSVIRC